MTDRRRVNGPSGQSLAPVFEAQVCTGNDAASRSRERNPGHTRSLYLRTGVTPSASGSAYLEVDPANCLSAGGGLKLICTVHGPRALPRSAPFSPHLILTTHVKYAPFATRHRRGYLRDSSEKDLSTHLETALRGSLIGERWPKSGVEVVVTVIEGERSQAETSSYDRVNWEEMNVLAGCITVAAAALSDAGIDSVDAIVGGVAGIVETSGREAAIILDPGLLDHRAFRAACCVAYLPARDEVTNIWLKGDLENPGFDKSEADIQRLLISRAIHASKSINDTLTSSLGESMIRH